MKFQTDATIKSITTKRTEDGPVSTIQLETELTSEDLRDLHELMRLTDFALTFNSEQMVMLRQQESTAPEVRFDALAGVRR